MKNYLEPGDYMPFTAGADLLSGDPVLIGTVVGVCMNDVLSGASGVAALKGVYTLPKATTDTPAQGAKMYWDNTAKKFTTTTTSNTLSGVAWAAAGNGDTIMKILLGRY